MKKILYISYAGFDINNMASQRYKYNVRYLRKEFDVFTISASHNDRVESKNYFVKDNGFSSNIARNDNGIKHLIKSGINRKYYAFLTGNTNMLPGSKKGWAKDALRIAEKIVEGFNIDLVYTSLGPVEVNFIGSSIKKKYPSVKWVAEYRDLWSDNYGSDYLAAQRLVNRYIEKFITGKCDLIITVSHGLKEKLGFLGKDVGIIYNGFSNDDYKIQSKKDLNQISYTGNKRDKQDHKIIIGAIDKIRKIEKDMTMHFYGTKIDKKQNSPFVFIHDLIPRSEIVDIQKRSKFLLSMEWEDDRQRGHLTGKVFEYIGAGGNIIVTGNTRGELADLVENNNFGKFCRSESEIVEYISEVKKKNYINNYDPSEFSRGFQWNILSESLKRLFN